MAIRQRLSALVLLSLLLSATGCPAALATETAGVGDAAFAVAEDASLEERRRARAAELEAIRRSMEVSERRQAALGDEIHGLEAERADLTAELIATAQRLRAAEEEIAAVESRLTMLHAREDVVRASLKQRRAVMSDVLMALQRMGQTPPPAILSRPEDALAAIRGSILAGAVLPDIRGEAEALAADLTSLTDLTAEIGSERDTLRANYIALGEEQARIDLLVASKQAQRNQTQAALSAEQERAGELAGEAESMQSLIDSMEQEIAAAAAADAQEQVAAREAAEEAEAEAVRTLDTSRIEPAMAFADAKGALTLPVAGETVLRFGETDSIGDATQGMSVAARPGAAVLAPADGWVVYAGPFRSYGQVLILNAGDDYHIVMAGMERIDVALRQFVLAGEPVATMGATRLASIAEIDHTSAQPVLYVEFRKDGTAIDPAPWWAAVMDGEVNG